VVVKSFFVGSLVNSMVPVHDDYDFLSPTFLDKWSEYSAVLGLKRFIIYI